MANRKVKNNIDLRVISEEHPRFIGAAVQFFTRYRDVFGYAMIGVLIVSVLLVLVSYNNRMKNAEASIVLQTALKQYQQDLTAATITMKATSEDGESPADLVVSAKSAGAFQSVYDNYPNTSSGQNALYMVAVSRLNTGKYDDAYQAFDSFLTKFPNHVLTPSAELGKATVMFNMGRTEESLNILNTLPDRYPEFKLLDIVEYEKAIRYEALGQWSDARASHQAVIDKYPDSAWKQTSENALKKLDRKATGESS